MSFNFDIIIPNNLLNIMQNQPENAKDDGKDVKSTPVPKYITVNARGTQILVLRSVLLRSKVFTKWLTVNENEPFLYINHCAKEVHNLIDYLSDYKHVLDDKLLDMFEEFLIDREYFDKIAQHLYDTKKRKDATHQYGYDSFDISYNDMNKSVLAMFVVKVKKDYNHVTVELKSGNYLIKCFSAATISEQFKVKITTGLLDQKTGLHVESFCPDIDFALSVLKPIISAKCKEYKFMHVCRHDSNGSGYKIYMTVGKNDVTITAWSYRKGTIVNGKLELERAEYISCTSLLPW